MSPGRQPKALRADGVTTPVMLLTAKGDTDDRITGLEAGADDFLTKPVDDRTLINTVNGLLAG